MKKIASVVLVLALVLLALPVSAEAQGRIPTFSRSRGGAQTTGKATARKSPAPSRKQGSQDNGKFLSSGRSSSGGRYRSVYSPGTTVAVVNQTGRYLEVSAVNMDGQALATYAVAPGATWTNRERPGIFVERTNIALAFSTCEAMDVPAGFLLPPAFTGLSEEFLRTATRSEVEKKVEELKSEIEKSDRFGSKAQKKELESWWDAFRKTDGQAVGAPVCLGRIPVRGSARVRIRPNPTRGAEVFRVTGEPLRGFRVTRGSW